MMKKRIIMFIDSSNFYFHAKKVLKRDRLKFHWGFLINEIMKNCYDSENYILEKAYYYSGLPDPRVDSVSYKKQKNFLKAIEAIEKVEVRTGYILKNKSSGYNTEKGVDTMIATDMAIASLKDECDGIILISADSDYVYCINELKKSKKDVVICFPEGVACDALSKVADRVVRLKKSVIGRCVNDRT